jgi:integrase
MAEAAKLTDAGIRKYRPKAERRRIRDTGADGLFLIIEPSGRKTFQMRYRKGKRAPKITLGPWHDGEEIIGGPPIVGMPLTLKSAHQLAAEVHRQRALGRDPASDHQAHKRRQQTEQAVAAKNTLAAAVRDYADHAKQEQRRWKETVRTLGLHADSLDPIEDGLVQRWRDRPVAEIDGHDVWSVVEEARKHAIPGLEARNKGASKNRARKLHATLSALFTWLQQERRVTANPCTGLHRPEAPPSRERTLDANEVQWFWDACTAVGEPFGPIFKLLLLTGARLNEVAGLRRTELHADGTWRLPGTRTKNHKAHIVPLSPAAQAIVAAVPNVHEIIFSTTGRSPPSGWSRAKYRLDQEMLKLAQQERGAAATIPPFRLHDLRRTCVTGLVELGVAPHLVELIINHISGARAGVAGTYNKAEMLPERRAALERWAAHLEGIVSRQPSNVVALRG